MPSGEEQLTSLGSAFRRALKLSPQDVEAPPLHMLASTQSLSQLPLDNAHRGHSHRRIVRQQRVDRFDVVETGMKLAKELAHLAAKIIIW